MFICLDTIAKQSIIVNMTEVFTQALVLDREPKNESDAYLILYTKELGKIFALAKSLRKITSKLSGHLVLGSVIQARIVGDDNFQLVDALGRGTPESPELFKFLNFVKLMTPLYLPDLPFWYEVERVLDNQSFGKPAYRRLLKVLGFDSKFAECSQCGKTTVAYFAAPDIIFLCRNCLSKFDYSPNAVFEI